MMRVNEGRPPSVRRISQKLSLYDIQCSPTRLLIRVSPSGWAGVVKYNPSGGLEWLPSIPWARNSDEINGWVTVLQLSLEDFRQKWSNRYLDAIEDSQGVGLRLRSFQPLCNWNDPSCQASEEAKNRWKEAAKSPELRNLAHAGRELYLRIFGADSGLLRAWVHGLPAGSRLSIYWAREDHNTVNIPWPLLYREELPEDGDKINPLGFLGLCLRLEYNESQQDSAPLGLGSPDQVYRGHLFFWRGRGPDYEEAQGQYTSWSAQPGFYAVPNDWPPNANDNAIKKLAKKLLKGDDPSPMALLYLYCQCTFNQNRSPVLYFGDPVSPDVTFTVYELPGSDTPFPCETLVFVNACSSDAPMSPGMANLLESNFLNRGCCAYLGTVNRIPIRIASRFAQAFFHFFLPRDGASPLTAGEAVSQARMFLWTQYNNIAGLYYNYINAYEIFMGDPNKTNGGPRRTVAT
jgi:hypothetical protein